MQLCVHACVQVFACVRATGHKDQAEDVIKSGDGVVAPLRVCSCAYQVYVKRIVCT
jgi:hypothetical protein